MYDVDPFSGFPSYFPMYVLAAFELATGEISVFALQIEEIYGLYFPIVSSFLAGSKISLFPFFMNALSCVIAFG